MYGLMHSRGSFYSNSLQIYVIHAQTAVSCLMWFNKDDLTRSLVASPRLTSQELVLSREIKRADAGLSTTLSLVTSPHLTSQERVLPRETKRADAGLNTATCVWIHFNSFGRSGNKVQQIMDVKEMLARCSGVASSDLQANSDPVLAFPPVLFATQEGSRDPSTILTLAAQKCQEVSYKWDYVETLARHKNCPTHPLYKISIPVDQIYSPSSPSLLANVFADRAFWKNQITTLDTMVMYFRGGDVLGEKAPHYYFQGPCSLFLESWKAANVSRAVLVYDKSAAINPCVEVVRRTIGNASIVPTPCDSAECHMMLVGRARYVVVSGKTTFTTGGFDLFPGRRRIIFRYFCDKQPPHESPAGLEVCVDGKSEGLVPWSYTNETRKAMMELPSQVVFGNMNVSTFRQYLQEGDDDHMASRLMRLRSL
jgi:hypothetical protein